jgi:hypothetical protein
MSPWDPDKTTFRQHGKSGGVEEGGVVEEEEGVVEVEGGVVEAVELHSLVLSSCHPQPGIGFEHSRT